MYKLLPILLFAYGLLVSEDNIITKSKMGSYESLILQSELVIDVDDNYGLTLNIKFNPLEIKSVTLHPISNIEYFSKKKSDSLISVFLFHSKAKRLPIFFKFNFTNIDGFYDISNVEFFKIEIMDKDGNKSEYPNQYLKIDFSEINQINRNNNIYEYMNKKDIYNDSWAVIIGIDKYKFSDQLNYAVKDAEAVKKMLINKFDYPEENIRYLVNEEATLSEIKLNLGEVATSAGEDDRILVFYSGHGETLKGADGSEKGYIIPYEGRQDNPFGTGFAMDEILTTSQMSKSKHMLFLMDACYSGLMTESVKGLEKSQDKGYLSKVANEKARQIITAGGRDEQVIERDEWQHSAFTKNLLAGLDDWEADTDDDGYVTADELGTYLRKSVTEDSDFHQTPQKGRFRNSGRGEFIFFNDKIEHNIYETTSLNSKNLISEILGCKDSLAWNFNPYATLDDFSCEYYSYGEVNIMIGEHEFNSLDILIMNPNHEIWGLQFELKGASIVDSYGGLLEQNSYTNIVKDNKFISFNIEGKEISKNDNPAVLVILSLKDVANVICIQDINIAGENGKLLMAHKQDCKSLY